MTFSLQGLSSQTTRIDRLEMNSVVCQYLNSRPPMMCLSLVPVENSELIETTEEFKMLAEVQNKAKERAKEIYNQNMLNAKEKS
jgi:hypothetical protein